MSAVRCQERGDMVDGPGADVHDLQLERVMLRRPPAEDLPQDQHGALPRRQVPQRGDEGQLEAVARSDDRPSNRS